MLLFLKLELFKANAGANAEAAGANAGVAGANAGAAGANVYWLNGWISIGLASDSQRNIIVNSLNPTQHR